MYRINLYIGLCRYVVNFIFASSGIGGPRVVGPKVYSPVCGAGRAIALTAPARGPLCTAMHSTALHGCSSHPDN